MSEFKAVVDLQLAPNAGAKLANDIKKLKIKVPIDVELSAKAQKTLKQLMGGGNGSGSGNSSKSVVNNNALFGDLRSYYKELYKYRNAREKINPLTNSDEYARVSANIADVVQRIKDVKGSLGSLNNRQLDILRKDAEQAARSLERVRSSVNDVNSALSMASRANGSERVRADISSLRKQMSALENSGVTIDGNIRRSIALVDELGLRYQAAMRIGNTSEIRAAQRAYNNELQRTNSLLRLERNNNSINSGNNKIAEQKKSLDQAKRNFSLQIDKWLKDNSAAAHDFGNQLKSLQTQLKRVNDTGSFNNIKKSFQEITLQAQTAGKTGLSFADRLAAQARKYLAYFGVASVMMQGTIAMRDMFQQTVEVDTAMTELRRVTDLTEKQYASLYSNMISSAKEYGAVLSDVINQTADWSRAGFNAQEALELTKISTMYQKVAGVTAEEGSKNILTALKGYEKGTHSIVEQYNNDAVAAAGHIADVFNELDNNYAVTAAGVGEAMVRSAASMNAANNTFEQTAALITGMTEVTQDPEMAGNALKVVSMRLRGMKGELQELGEDVDENVENLSKMQGQILNLTHGKVNIFDDNGDFKSTYEILQGIAEVWHDISDTDQAQLLETIAGKHRANAVASLMGNWENTEKALQSSLNSDGSAAREYDKYLNSLQAHLDKLQTSWQTLSNTTMSTGFLNSGIDVIIGLVDALNALIETLGVIPTIAGIVGTALSFKGIGIASVDKQNVKFKIFGNTLTDVTKKVKVFKNSLSSGGVNGGLLNILGGNSNQTFGTMERAVRSDINALNMYKRAITNGMNARDAFNRHMLNASESAQQLANRFNSSNYSGMSREIKQWANAERQLNVTQFAQQKTLSSAAQIIREYNNGVKNAKMSQVQFATAAAAGNPILEKVIANAGGGKIKFSSYASELVKTTAKTVALTAASTAMNAVIGGLVGIAISLAINGIMHLINAEKELKESVEDTTTTFNEQRNSLMSGKSGFESAAKTYVKLSQGVNELGKNISLSADDYQKYVELRNQIAEQVPSLVQGYDAEGNAILKNVSSVEDLTNAYNELIAANNKTIKDKGKDIAKDLSNDLKKIKGQEKAASALKEIGESKDIDAAIDAISKQKDGYSRIQSAVLKVQEEMRKAGYDASFKANGNAKNQNEFLKNVYAEHKDLVQKVISNYESELNSSLADMRSLTQAWFSDAMLPLKDSSGNLKEGYGQYSGLSDTMKEIASQVIGNLDGDFYKQFLDDSGNMQLDKLYDGLSGIMDKFSDLGKVDSGKIENLFDLQNKFKNGKISVDEYLSAINSASDAIGKLDENAQKTIYTTLGVKYDGVDGGFDPKKVTFKAKQALEDNLKSISIDDSVIKEFVGGLNGSDLTFAATLTTKFEGAKTAKDLREILELEKALQGIGTIDIETETQGIESLNTALKESKSATGLAASSIENLKSRYKDLEGYDASKLFEETANGIRINTQEVNKLESAYAKQNKQNVDKNLETLKTRYDELSDAIKNTKDATERAQLWSEREDIKNQINSLAALGAQYDALTSKYKAWQDAESAGSDRDMYESVLSGFKNVDDELSRGWIDDGTKEFIQLLSGKDLSTASLDEYRSAWEEINNTVVGAGYTVRDFFTQDANGNSTSDGVYNFFDAISANDKISDAIKRDNDGNIISFDFKTVGGDKAIADALNTSEELVQIMLRAAEDAGFVVNFEGTYTQLADLKNEAEEAVSVLNEATGKEYSFDFNTSSLKSAEDELEKAQKMLKENKDFWNEDGTFNFDAKGATEAMQIVSALQAQVNQLSKGKYQLDMSVDDTKLKEPLEELQNYGRTVMQLNQLKLNPKANADEIIKLEDSLKKTAEYFHGLDNDTKLQVGIDLDDSVEDIQDKLESGEIQIPGTIDLDIKMADSLEDLVKTSLLGSGVLSGDEEAEIKQELKVKYEVKPETSEAKQEIDDATENLVGSDGDTKIDIQIGAKVENEEDVDAMASKLESLSDRTVRAIAEVFGDLDVSRLQSIMNMLDDKTVEAIAKAIGEGDVQGLKDTINSLPSNTVNAVAKTFGFKDVEELNAAIDNLDPKTVQAVAEAFGIKDVDSLRNAVKNLDGKTVEAIAEAKGEDGVINLQNAIDGLRGRTVTVWAQIKKVASDLWNKVTGGSDVDGTANVNGTAFASGTAYKRGNWGTKGSGTALMGELGPETIVRDGRFFTVGDNGAEFVKYQPGDIIFNHKQTEELFANGRVTSGHGRASALVEGTAFAYGSHGTGGGWGRPGTGSSTRPSSSSSSSSSGSSSSSSSKSSSSSSSEEKEFKEKIDWIEIAINRIERAISRLDLKAKSIYKKWGTRNSALVKQIDKTRDEIDLQAKAYDRYVQEANSVGLSENYASKVRNGTIDIETITDEDLKKKIDEYKQWYEKALDCKDAIDKLKESVSELYKQKFDNVVTEFDGFLSVIEHEKNMLDEYVSQTEARGYIVSTNYYKALIKNQEKQITELEEKRADMIAAMNDAVNSGAIAKNSEAWYVKCHTAWRQAV